MRDYEPVHPISPPPPHDWFELDDGSRDILNGFHAGVTHRHSTVHLDGVEHDITLMDSVLDLAVQLSDPLVAALRGGVELSTRFRRAGVGRVRKDPYARLLEPDPENTWVQSARGDAVLVLRLDPGVDRFAFFRLGALQIGGRAEIFDPWFSGPGRITVTFWAAEDFLPNADHQHRRRLIAEHRGLGASVCFMP